MTNYVGILEGEGAVRSIRIPDVPGGHGGGDTADHALSDTMSALREVAQCYATRGITLRTPRTIQDVVADPASEFSAATEVAVMIPLLLDQARPVSANISIDAGLLATIDAEAKKLGLTRLAFLARAVRDKIISTA
jgi:HicB_like antitoxin of bacterial toxin-antitoxin system